MSEDQPTAQAASSLRRQNEILKAVLDSIADGVAVVDENGNFLFFNPAAERLVGIGAVEAPPEEWAEQFGLFLPDGQTPYPPDELPLTLAMHGEVVKEAQVFVRNAQIPDGAMLSINATPLLNERGEVKGGVAVFRDITIHKRFEEKLKMEERLLRKLLDLQERERKLVSHELHDGVVQDMVGAKLLVDTFCHERPSGDDAAELPLHVTSEILGRGIKEARRMIRELRPMVLDEEGIVPAIHHLIADEKRIASLAVKFTHDVRFERLEAMLEGAIFRIVQEALNNVKRHSGVDEAEVTLAQHDDQLRLEIRDRGRGFQLASVPGDRFGIRGIRERARLFGGSARITTAPGKGTRVTVTLPVQEPGDDGAV